MAEITLNLRGCTLDGLHRLADKVNRDMGMIREGDSEGRRWTANDVGAEIVERYMAQMTGEYR